MEEVKKVSILFLVAMLILAFNIQQAFGEGCDECTIPNGDFEIDPVGTSYSDINNWDYNIIVHKGNPPTGDELQIVDDYYFEADKSVYSYLQTKSVSPFPGDNWVSQYLSTEEPVCTTADYITLWIGGDGYTTSSRYYWHIDLILTDGTNTYSEILRADAWDPVHYDYYDATETGADGNEWKRYTREIPGNLDKSNLTIKIRHYQASWDLTTASSWYRLDNIYFSDSEGNPCDHDIAVTNVTPCETVARQGDCVCINATVENQGNCPETFNVSAYYKGIIPNGDFETDPVGTSYSDINNWDYNIIVHKGNPPTGDDLQIVDDYYFEADKSVYSYLQTKSVSPFPGDSVVSQDLSTEQPVKTSADYITLWIGGDSYTTSSRYHWYIQLVLTDGTNTYTEVLRCDCWGNNEGCNPNHYDYYDATETGADGNTWKRYTREIPGNLDKSNLTVTIRHRQASWDLTTASSRYRLDNIYFSDSQGNPILIGTKLVTDLAPGDETTLTFAWNTKGVAPGDYVISAYAHPAPCETDTDDNTYIDGTITILPGFIPGDINEDGYVNFLDIAILAANWLECNAPGDPDCTWEP